MTPDIIELFKSVCEKMRKADYVEARSDMLQALERFEHSKPQTINWVNCSDRLPEQYKLVLLWQGSHIYLGFLARLLSDENGWVIPIGYTLNLDKISHWCEIEGPKE